MLSSMQSNAQHNYLLTDRAWAVSCLRTGTCTKVGVSLAYTISSTQLILFLWHSYSKPK